MKCTAKRASKQQDLDLSDVIDLNVQRTALQRMGDPHRRALLSAPPTVAQQLPAVLTPQPDVALHELLFMGEPVRYVDRGEDFWFVAKDVCDILDIGNSRQAVSYLDDDEKNTVITNDGIRGNPELSIVSEAGLYSLILRSRKPEAKAFKRWVTHEVLPKLRRHGVYVVTPTSLEDMTEALARQGLKLVEELRAIKQQLTLQEAKVELQTKQLTDATATIEQQAPKAAFYDDLMDSDGYYTMHQVAKILGIGVITLFSRLRQLGVLLVKEWNLPAEDQRAAGRFVVKASTYQKQDGSKHKYTKTVVTAKGLEYLRSFKHVLRLHTIDLEEEESGCAAG